MCAGCLGVERRQLHSLLELCPRREGQCHSQGLQTEVQCPGVPSPAASMCVSEQVLLINLLSAMG